MRWTRLTPADGHWMPWKNGGGRTLELAVDPLGATLAEGFRWRLSTAEVAVSGPFSAFPGVDRLLLLLEGEGFHLDFGAHGQVALREVLSPVAFSGDWPASAELVDGPCTDFNVMVDRRRCAARVEAFRLDAPRALALGAATVLVFVARGIASAPDLGLHLGRRHTLRIDGGAGTLSLAPGLCGADVVVTRLDSINA
ncbi:HutD family protein [Geothrix sp. 21YS21S-4]|uniref:HutD/Ves family protein n=1 Tax=Geothrix sp. 21YS21S-4 TaxID=3068889 RepID=UPI0027BB12AC|nr:HutD family protein [Geothrix sp. 21YS21S-4]